MTITAGIDVGTGAIKAVVFDVEDGGAGGTKWLARQTEKIRQRDPLRLAREAFENALEEAGVKEEDVAYIATTGEAESLEFTTGHFYSMTTHARGGIYLEPKAGAIIDCGALHGRAIIIDERGKVLNYRMTSQCASGSGQFLENIARYLGITQEEIGELSQQADAPEKVSSICAVLSETDVINMVSRQVSTPNILKGIHQSMAGRLVKLLRAIKMKEGTVLMSGGLALDTGLLAALNEEMVNQKVNIEVLNHPDSIYSGAIGAAIWGAFRHEKLSKIGALPIAS
ncbi:MAG TPA: benzoyl-CoA reductase subunit D [Rhodospirillales bacterium]|nr:benzoyl-CoA reductase subunit D [Rhodospirillales bacterium]|tara:strand:+ start:96 stop:947 length:852 start_codon:yes stop_codon:yes gene_type:complete